MRPLETRVLPCAHVGWSEAVSAIALVGSCGLFHLAQPPQGLGALGMLALVPWLLATSKRRTWFTVASGLLFGTFSSLLSVGWVTSGFESLGASPLRSELALLTLVLWGGGIPWAIFAFGVGASRGVSAPWRTAILAGLAIAIDLARSHLPGGVPWMLLGHTQIDAPGLSQLAAVIGVPGLSGLLVALNVAVTQALEGVDLRRASITLGAVVGGAGALAISGEALSGAFLESTPAARRKLDVLIVQPSLHPRERWSPIAQRTNLAEIARQTREAIDAGVKAPGLVVWPENTLTTPIEASTDLESALKEAIRRIGVPVLLGAVASPASPSPRVYRNAAMLWSESGEPVDRIDKTRAIPIAERAGGSIVHRAIERLIGLSPARPRIEEGSKSRPLDGAMRFAAVLCYEIFFPGLVAGRLGEEGAMIVNLANDSWFSKRVASDQQLALARFRAIETRRWLVRAVHGGASAFVDPLGRITRSLPFGERGALREVITAGASPGSSERLALLAVLFAGGMAGAVVAGFATRIGFPRRGAR